MPVEHPKLYVNMSRKKRDWGSKKISHSPNTNVFEQSVKATPDIENHFKPGLQALGQYASCISASANRSLGGSVDIDSATTDIYPEDARWDYAIGYKNQAYFIEIHPMYTSEVRRVLKKKEWLENWLVNKAPELLKIKTKEPLIWIASKRFAILKNSREYRLLAKNNIQPLPELKL